MNIYRWLLPACLGTASVCCVVYPGLASGQTRSALDSRKDPNTSLAVPQNAINAPSNSETTGLQAFALRPLSFERNVGQTDPGVKFVSRGVGYSLALSSNRAVLSLYQDSDFRNSVTRGQHLSAVTTTALQMSLVGANPNAEMSGIDPLPGNVNYLLGNDPKHWHLHVPNYARVKYESVYPGIDLVYYGNQRQLEYDFLVAPGADPTRIRLEFEGAKALRVDPKTGDLVITAGDGSELHHKRPVVYQKVGGRQAKIAGSYRVLDQKHVAFTVASYDSGKTLVIDPTLAFFRVLAGSEEDFPAGIAIDSAGNAYITGVTFSTDFPRVGAAPGPVSCLNGGTAVQCSPVPFVSKVSPKGAVLFSTYIGGDSTTSGNSTFAFAIAADLTGAYITGITSSTNFVTNPKYAFGGNNMFVARLDPSGEYYHWVVALGGETSTKVNGFGANVGTGIALDSHHAAYVTGYTTAIDFPTTEYFAGQHKSWRPVYAGGQDAFAAKVMPSGTLDGGYSTYIGGSGFDAATGIAVDSSGYAYVTGYTESTNFPLVNSHISGSPAGGGQTAFVTKLLPNGSGVVYSTYLGGKPDATHGAADDNGNSIAVNSLGDAFVTGATCSTNFPTTHGALQTTQPLLCTTRNINTIFNTSAFVTEISAHGYLMYSTYLGGTGTTDGFSIALNRVGNVYVGGYTSATKLIQTNPFASPDENTGFVTKLSPTLNQDAFITWAGSEITGVATLSSLSNTLPITTQVYVSGCLFRAGTNVNNDQNLDAFVIKWTDVPKITTAAAAQ